MSQDLPVVEHNPKNELAFGKEAAKYLLAVVRAQGLARKFGGQKEHLYVEAWQLLGQFAGIYAIPEDASPITVNEVQGAIAHVALYDGQGRKVGAATAYCMRDEPNWRHKPWFQLASMAQTRAVSKAFRTRLAWIAILGGYSGTPAEEMENQPEIEKDAAVGAGLEILEKATGGRKIKPKESITTPEEARKTAADYMMKQYNLSISDLEDKMKKPYTKWGEEELEKIRIIAKEMRDISY